MTLTKSHEPIARVEELVRQIQDLAFRLFQERAEANLWDADGHDLDDWLTAERALFEGPGMELIETPTGFEVIADLNGFEPKDLHVTATAHGVAIESDQSGENQRQVFRMVRFSEPVDVDQIMASYRDGSLTIQVPRKAAAPDPVRQVPVETEKALAATA